MVSNRPDKSGEDRSRQPLSEQQPRSHEQTYGGRIGDQLKDTGRSIVTEQKARACEELETISEVVHEAADRLHERDDHVVAEYVDALADQVERAADFVREHSASDLIEMTNDFARRRPEVVLGAAFVLGLAAARFLKASRSKSPRSGRQNQSSNPEPFQSSVARSGGGFETRTSEAGPIATTPRQSPGAQGRSEPGAGDPLGGSGSIRLAGEAHLSKEQTPEDKR